MDGPTNLDDIPVSGDTVATGARQECSVREWRKTADRRRHRPVKRRQGRDDRT